MDVVIILVAIIVFVDVVVVEKYFLSPLVPLYYYYYYFQDLLPMTFIKGEQTAACLRGGGGIALKLEDPVKLFSRQDLRMHFYLSVCSSFINYIFYQDKILM